MYELEGYKYSLEEITKAAEDSNLTIEEYITSNNIKKVEEKIDEPVKEVAVVDKTADATAVNEQTAVDQNTELQSENISLDLKNDNFKNGELRSLKKFDEQGNEIFSSDIGLKKYFDDFLDSANQYAKEADKNMLSLDRELVQTGVSLLNTLRNIPIGVQTSIIEGEAAGLLWLSEIGEDSAPGADFLVGKGGTVAYKDPETEELITFKKNKDKYKELQKQGLEAVYEETGERVGLAADKRYIELIKKAQLKKQERRETGSIVGGIKSGDFSETLGGVFNGVGSVVETMLPAVLTRGLSLAPQIVAPIVNDFNVEKAKTLYPESSLEDGLMQLKEQDQVDIATPLVIGTLAASLEYVGIKGVSNAIAKSAFNFRGLGTLMYAGLGEGTTELFQTGLETASLSKAQGKNSEQAVMDGLNEMASDRGLESFLQGFVGAVAIGAGGSSVNRALRNDTNGINTVNSSINSLNKLNTQKNNTKDKQTKSLIEDEINIVSQNLKTYLQTNQKLASFLNKDQKNQLIDLINKKDKFELKQLLR